MFILVYAKKGIHVMPHKSKYAVRKVPLVDTRVEKQPDY